jgi:hypothetical protein
MDELEIDNSEQSIIFRFTKESPVPKNSLKNKLTSEGYSCIGEEEFLFLVKENTELIYDWEEPLIIVREEECNTLSKSSDEIEALIFDQIGIDESDLESAQYQFEGRIWRKCDTLEVFNDNWDVPEFESVLGKEPSLSGIRVQSENFDPDDNDMYDLKIESYVENTEYYHIVFGYRKPEIDQIEDYINQPLSQLGMLVEILEERGDST